MSKPVLQLKTTTLIEAETIAARVLELGRDIAGYYRDQPLTMIAVMNGAMIFAADLARAIAIPLWLDSLRVSSYRGLESSGGVSFASLPKLPLTGRHILLVDDILDTGLTMKKIIRKMLHEQPLSVKTCVLFDKQDSRGKNGLNRADWTGFQIPPEYIVGYGLDAEEYYRNQPGVSIVVTD